MIFKFDPRPQIYVLSINDMKSSQTLRKPERYPGPREHTHTSRATTGLPLPFVLAQYAILNPLQLLSESSEEKEIMRVLNLELRVEVGQPDPHHEASSGYRLLIPKTKQWPQQQTAQTVGHQVLYIAVYSKVMSFLIHNSVKINFISVRLYLFQPNLLSNLSKKKLTSYRLLWRIHVVNFVFKRTGILPIKMINIQVVIRTVVNRDDVIVAGQGRLKVTVRDPDVDGRIIDGATGRDHPRHRIRTVDRL